MVEMKKKVQLSPIAPSKSSLGSADSYFGSFTANPSPTDAQIISIEDLINFLNDKVDGAVGNDGPSWLSEFVDLVRKSLKSRSNPMLVRVLKAFGWSGNRFKLEKKLFDREKLAQTLTNLYLKSKYQNRGISAYNFLEVNDDEEEDEMINHLDKIGAFSPDLVVNYLHDHPTALSSGDTAPITYSFTGSCMLVDISGFSKFSAAMCSQGIKGLDELRMVTNGLLAKFVKSVYEHEGDGKYRRHIFLPF